MGTPLMPWQEYVLDVALELVKDPTTGKWRFAYRNVILTVPRQSGKTTLLLVLILVRALSMPKQNIRYTAQTAKDARDKWMDDWLPVLEGSEFSSTFRVRKTNGHEALIFNNGSHQGLVATTKKSGHGGSIDLGVMDESFAHPDARLEQALGPAMITRPSPQLWVVSTAGTFEDSPYLWGKVENGRHLVEQGITEGTAYFEWSADENADPADEATWWSCMPALGITASVDSVRAEYEKPGDNAISEFRRAYLNQWVTALTDPVIPLARWDSLVDARSVPLDPVTLAFDVSPDRAWGAICAAGRRSDGRFHIEVVEHRANTAWMASEMAALVSKHRPAAVYCDPSGPAGALLSEMVAEKVTVTPINTREHGQACGMFYDAAMQDPPDGPKGLLRHLGTPELRTALDGALKRRLGDAWAWDRRHSSVDISPLVASTIALWGSAQQKPPKSPSVISLAQVLAENPDF